MSLWRIPRWLRTEDAERERRAAHASYRTLPQTYLTLLVCGGKSYAGRDHVFRVLDRIHDERRISHLLQDGSTGVAMLARSWARNRRVFLSTVSDFLPASQRACRHRVPGS